ELDRIHRRDAQAITHRGVRGRATPLTEHALAARKAHDVPHDQKVAREPKFTNECEFVCNLRIMFPCALLRPGRPPSFVCALLNEAREVLVGAHARRKWKCRQRGLELRETKRASFRNIERCPNAF